MNLLYIKFQSTVQLGLLGIVNVYVTFFYYIYLQFLKFCAFENVALEVQALFTPPPTPSFPSALVPRDFNGVVGTHNILYMIIIYQ